MDCDFVALDIHIDARVFATCVEKMLATRPHEHFITNTVAQNFTANVLLASGMTPSMTVAAEEMEGFLSLADALLINIGTMDEERRAAIGEATAIAAKRNLPWLLDPVFSQSTEPRLNLS